MEAPCEKCLVFTCCKNRILEKVKKRWTPSYLMDRLMSECPNLKIYLINTKRDYKVVKYIYTLFRLPYISLWHGDVISMTQYMNEHYEKEKVIEMINDSEKIGPGTLDMWRD